MIDISIIIVNYNVKEFLQNSIYSIKKAASKLSHEIIVVDNASDDGSVEMIKEKFPDVVLFENKSNLGFGAANNQGIESSKGKYILIVNPDTILNEDTLDVMIDFLEKNSEAGMAGCKVLNPDGTLQLGCRRSFPGPWTSFTKVFGLSKLFPDSKFFARYNLTYLDENKTYEVDAISGSFMVLKREVYNKIGGFDTQFFMYGEDLDLCYRVQKAGYKVYYHPETEIIHYKGESTKRSSIDETKNFYEAMKLFVRKHLSSSFIVTFILEFAITLRSFFTFLNVNRVIFLGIIIDFILFALALFVSEKIYRPGNWFGFPPESKPWVYIIPSFIQVNIAALIGSYRKNALSILRILSALFIGLLFLSAIPFFFKQVAFSRAVLLITFSFSIMLLPLWRFIFRLKFSLGLGTKTQKLKTVIVGTTINSVNLKNKLLNNPSKLFKIAGFIGSDHKLIGEEVDGLKVIGSVQNIKKIVEDEKIDQIIFVSEQLKYNEMFSVISSCNDTNVNFLIAGKELDFMVGKSNVTVLDDIPFMQLEYNITKVSHKIQKMVFDVGLSFILTIFLFPIVFLFRKTSGKRTDFIIFILSIPKVLTGKKSLIGPLLNDNKNGLYLGKPGLTGLWYTENIDKSDNEEINKINLFYAKNQSIWLDFEILGKAFSKMIYKG